MNLRTSKIETITSSDYSLVLGIAHLNSEFLVARLAFLKVIEFCKK